ncbi:MAG: hypothetical protein HRU19_11615 [Pseudobacteriovorax sp.]|nr:hypothetical protein [Pseudobacteriovorax sp.]
MKIYKVFVYLIIFMVPVLALGEEVASDQSQSLPEKKDSTVLDSPDAVVLPESQKTQKIVPINLEDEEHCSIARYMPFGIPQFCQAKVLIGSSYAFFQVLSLYIYQDRQAAADRLSSKKLENEDLYESKALE